MQKLLQNMVQSINANRMMEKIVRQTILDAESQGLKVEIFHDELLITEVDDETNGKA